MPISPVGSVIYANQMLAVQAMKQADTQHALILQNSAAVAIENETELVKFTDPYQASWSDNDFSLMVKLSKVFGF